MAGTSLTTISTLPVWTNKLCTTSLRGKDFIFYANRLVTFMYWVVNKWATLRKPKLIRIGPQGAPINRARMKDPSLHEPSKKVLQMKTWSCSFLDESPQKGQSTTSLPSIKASPSTWKKARWICPNSKPIKGGSSHEIMQRIRAHPNSPENDSHQNSSFFYSTYRLLLNRLRRVKVVLSWKSCLEGLSLTLTQESPTYDEQVLSYSLFSQASLSQAAVLAQGLSFK